MKSEYPHIALPISLVNIATRYSGSTPLYWGHSSNSGYPGRNSGSHASPVTKSTSLLVETHNNKVHEEGWTEVSSNTRSARSRAAATPSTHAVPGAARELCRLQDMTCEPPNGHAFRGLCGGRLHGMCGEVEDPDDGLRPPE